MSGHTGSASNGDVLISSEDGHHFLTVVPHFSLRLPFDDLTQATSFARTVAVREQRSVWRTTDGLTFELL
jgi:hypothetical protein